MHFRFHPTWVTRFIIPGNVRRLAELEEMGECVEVLYFETKSCFVFFENDFTYIKLLLQEDNQIISISAVIFISKRSRGNITQTKPLSPQKYVTAMALDCLLSF